MEIYFATTNKGKVASLQRDLTQYGMQIIQFPIDLIEPRSSDVEEIATAKIKQAFAMIQKPTIVVDSGFYIPALNGFPRAYVNFALATIGLEGILDLVRNKPRDCEFRDCLAYQDPSLESPVYFIRTVKGTIANEVRGIPQKHAWSPLSRLFIPLGSEKTNAETTPEEYAAWKQLGDPSESLGQQLYLWLSKKSS